MDDRDKPRGIAIGRTRRRSSSAPDLPLDHFRRKRSRTQEELETIARRVAENTTLMQQFRAAIGSENRDLARQVSEAITRYAQELDPTITYDEGTNIVLTLMVGHPSKQLGLDD
ncbi:MAG TPA: hypothetical protein VFI58_12260 [Xanthobacteraceae bacterium]|nr:hypothetical protein [Xanthobacteraceae bacterium]